MSKLKRNTKLSLIIAGAAVISACSESSPPPPSAGEAIYVKSCKVCHANGLNGAPIFGNATMWGKRTPQGLPTLIQHAIEGYGLMPAKGGYVNLSDSDVALAVEYMVEQATP